MRSAYEAGGYPTLATGTILVTALVAGAWLHSCVVPASAGLFALGAFHAHMDRHCPHRRLRAALCCIAFGLMCAVLCAALLIMAVGALLRWWPAASEHAGLSIAAVLVLFLALQLNTPLRGASQQPMLSLAVITLALSNFGWTAAECLFAAAAAVVLGRHGWHLMHDTASQLLQES